MHLSELHQAGPWACSRRLTCLYDADGAVAGQGKASSRVSYTFAVYSESDLKSQMRRYGRCLTEGMQRYIKLAGVQTEHCIDIASQHRRCSQGGPGIWSTCAAMVHHSSAAGEQPIMRRIAAPQHVHILRYCHALRCAQPPPTCPQAQHFGTCTSLGDRVCFYPRTSACDTDNCSNLIDIAGRVSCCGICHLSMSNGVVVHLLR